MNASTLLDLEQARHTAAVVVGCFEGMDVRTRVVGLALMAELQFPYNGNGTSPAHPLLETVRVSGDALGRYDAVRVLFPDHLQDSTQFIPYLEDLQSIMLDIHRYGAAKQETAWPLARLRNGDSLFDIIRVKEWDNPGNWNASTLSWLVRTGQWAYWNMNESSRVLLCRIAAASLSHRDIETSWLTLKLGRQLGFSLLLTGDERTFDISIEDMLSEVSELPSASDRAASWAAAMHRRVNMALFSLYNHRAVSDIAWPANYRFANFEGDGAVPPGWISSRISFKGPSRPEPREGKATYHPLHLLKI